MFERRYMLSITVWQRTQRCVGYVRVVILGNEILENVGSDNY